MLQYGTGQFAPGIPYGLTGQYHCGHHLLQAHVRTVKIYHDTYKPQVTGGMIGITLNIDWGEPFNASDPAGEDSWQTVQQKQATSTMLLCSPFQ